MTAFINHCRSNLLLCLTLLFAAGIIVRDTLAAAPLVFVLPILATLALSSWLIRRETIALVLLCCCFFLLGSLRGNQQQTRIGAPAAIETLAKDEAEVVLIGRLAALVADDGLSSRALIDVDHLKKAADHYFQPIRVRLLLRLKDRWPDAFLPGDELAVRARLRLPHIGSIPGTFDYRQYLARRDITAIAMVASPLLIAPADNQLADDGRSGRYWIERIRTIIGNHLDSLLDQPAAGLYRALLIGDRSRIAPDTMESFKGAGVAHILAISGMHLGLLGFFSFQTISWLMRRSEYLTLHLNVKKVSMLLCLPPLLFYTLLAGAQPPVVRSFIMALFVVVALGSDRLKSPFTTLAGAALVILFYDPFSLEEASFQLSFAAVAAIMLIVPPLLRRFGSNDPELSRASRLRLWLIGAVAVTVAATIGTMPLLLYHFHRIATVSVAANLIIEPLICLWAMVLGLIALPLLPVSLTAVDLLLHAGSWALIAAAAVASYISSLPFSSIWLPSPAPWLMILYYLILAIWLTPPATAFGRRPLIGVAFVCCLLSFFLPLTPLSDRFKDQERISVLDVGHGNGVLVELRDGRKILIDGGSRSSPGFDCGTALLAPYLWHRGIAHLDDIIISHADADHYNGVPAVLKRFTVDRLWLPYLDSNKPGYTHLCQLARRHGVTLLFPKGGVFIEGEGYRFIAAGTAIGAPAERRWITASDATEDDNGLVVLLQTPLFSMLFPGDIGRARERELLASHASLQAELMVASHHGSATSNSPAFLTAVSPKQLIVSSGDRDGSLFPSESLRSFVHRHRTTLLTTVEHGTLVIVGTDDGYRIHSFKDGRWTMGEPDSGVWITPR